MGSVSKVVLWLPYMILPLEASRGQKWSFWGFLTAKNLNFQAQRLYWTPTIEITYANEFPEQSCSMIALHDLASRGL